MGCADVLSFSEGLPGEGREKRRERAGEIRVGLTQSTSGDTICHSWAPGRPDTLQSRSDRCIQINQLPAGKGLQSSRPSETGSGLKGQTEAKPGRVGPGPDLGAGALKGAREAASPPSGCLSVPFPGDPSLPLLCQRDLS